MKPQPDPDAGEALLAMWGAGVLYALDRTRRGMSTKKLERSARHALDVALGKDEPR